MLSPPPFIPSLWLLCPLSDGLSAGHTVKWSCDPGHLHPWHLAHGRPGTKEAVRKLSLDKYILFCAGFGAMLLVILYFSWMRKLRLQRLSHCPGSSTSLWTWAYFLCTVPRDGTWHLLFQVSHLGSSLVSDLSPQHSQESYFISARKNATRSRWNVCCYSGVWVLLWTPEQRNVGQMIALPSISVYYPTFLILCVRPQVEDS